MGTLANWWPDWIIVLIASFMGPIWGPLGADRTQVGPMLAAWTLLSGWTFSYGNGNFRDWGINIYEYIYIYTYEYAYNFKLLRDSSLHERLSVCAAAALTTIVLWLLTALYTRDSYCHLWFHSGTREDCGARHRYLQHGKFITSHKILWDGIT